MKNQGRQHRPISSPGLQAGGRAPKEMKVGTLIIGSGAAALNAALCLWESGVRDILIVTEQWGGGTSNNAGSDKQTYYKLSLDPSVPDSASEMASDLSLGGAMHGDIALCEAQHSLQAFYNLVRLGVPFPHNQFGAYPGYKTDHDPRARATSAGPLTSHLMFKYLANKVKEYGIPVDNHVVIIDLLTDGAGDMKRITGATGINRDFVDQPGHGVVLYSADNVILATGGPAGIYHNSVYPDSQTGSIGMALKIGAKAQNLSISQFGIASLKFRWNLSGSYQQVIPMYFSTDEQGSDKKEFLTDNFPDLPSLFTAIFLKGYQWPFDSKKLKNNGSSMIDLLIQQETSCGRRVFMDFTQNPSGFNIDKLQSIPREYLERSAAWAATPIERLKLLNQPAIDLYKSHGIDITAEPLEIAVCAQHNNGGLTGDIWWESNIRHLFPIGEVSGTHGNTRPGGSALNSGQVGGIRVAMKIVKDGGSKRPIGSGIDTITNINHTIEKLISGRGSLDFREALTEVRHRMTDHGGPVRNSGTIRREVVNAWELWHRMNSDLKPVIASDLITALRTLDLCLTHAVYLEAIAEQCEKSADETFVRQNILEVSLDENLAVKIDWVPVRPIPQEDMWFENVWKNFRK